MEELFQVRAGCPPPHGLDKEEFDDALPLRQSGIGAELDEQQDVGGRHGFGAAKARERDPRRVVAPGRIDPLRIGLDKLQLIAVQCADVRPGITGEAQTPERDVQGQQRGRVTQELTGAALAEGPHGGDLRAPVAPHGPPQTIQAVDSVMGLDLHHALRSAAKHDR